VATAPMSAPSLPNGHPPQIVNHAPPFASPSEPVSVRYLENSPILVHGPVTRRHYKFSGSSAVQSIDARDASAILQSPLFRRG
jgi:hypothetical protein